MKKTKLLLNVFLVSMILFLFSCQQEDLVNVEPVGVEFTLTTGGQSEDGRIKDQPVVEEGMCDLSLADYAIVMINEKSYKIKLNEWGGVFKTNLVELEPGDYTVESFVVYNEDDEPLFATPGSNSDFDKFVNIPLPIELTINNYKKLEYNIEVLCVEDFSPSQFGFAFWSLDMKATKNLCVFVNYCQPDFGHKVATLAARIYPGATQTSEEDLIWSSFADGDYNSESETNELLCIRFPYDPELELDEQKFYVELDINNNTYSGTIDLDWVEKYKGGYLHLNKNCKGDFGPFQTTFNIAWEDINDEKGAEITNDMDYNDFVVSSTVYTDDNGLNFHFVPQARGADYHHDFRIKLPGSPSEYVIKETTGGTTKPATMMASPGGDSTYVVVYKTTLDAFDKTGNYINVRCDGMQASGIEKIITIEKAAKDFTFYLIDPFTANLNVAGSPNYDLYLGSTSTFTKDGNLYPNGLITPVTWAWPTERTDIRDIYGEDFITDFTPDSPKADRPGSLLYTECN